jgi:hypothetical protein
MWRWFFSQRTTYTNLAEAVRSRRDMTRFADCFRFRDPGIGGDFSPPGQDMISAHPHIRQRWLRALAPTKLDEWVTVEISPLHSSYERGCQEKILLPAPRRDAGVVTYIQSRLVLGRVIGSAALVRRRLQRRSPPQLLVPTRSFHELRCSTPFGSEATQAKGWLKCQP